MADIKLYTVLDDSSLQTARMLDIKLYMMLDVGSLQAARMSDIKLDIVLDDSSHVRHLIRHDARCWLAASSSPIRH